MYECPLKHVPSRAFYNNGEEWCATPHLCLKCSTEFVRTANREDKNKIVFTDTCPQCGHIKKDEVDLVASKEEKVDSNFAKDRERFCMTNEEG